VAAKKRSRPFYEVFLERVIRIDPVQRHRAAVTDQGMKWFFSEGRLAGLIGEFLWCLEAPTVPQLYMISVSLPMQHARDAAIAAFTEFIAAIVNGELIASGVDPATGVRHVLDPAEWTGPNLTVDVRCGDLIEATMSSPSRVRWSDITLRAAKQPRQTRQRGHGYDWEGAWTYATALRAEDQWDWTQHRRDKKQPLPAIRKVVEDKIKQWFAAKGGVPDISDIRQNITIPLYAGRRTRGKRKR
jgi:hypothetical protein